MFTSRISATAVPMPQRMPCNPAMTAIGTADAIIVTATRKGMTSFKSTRMAAIAAAAAASVIYFVFLTEGFVGVNSGSFRELNKRDEGLVLRFLNN